MLTGFIDPYWWHRAELSKVVMQFLLGSIQIDRCKEVESMPRQTLAQQDKVLEEEHSYTLTSMNNLQESCEHDGASQTYSDTW